MRGKPVVAKANPSRVSSEAVLGDTRPTIVFQCRAGEESVVAVVDVQNCL